MQPLDKTGWLRYSIIYANVHKRAMKAGCRPVMVWVTFLIL